MRQLTIKNFSCISQATLTFGRLTVLIGPQASGKSVLCKLAYFFLDVFQEQTRLISAEMSFDEYKAFIKTRFIDWFPVSAWGEKKFSIEFTCGQYSICITRKTYRGETSDDFRIRFSAEAEQQYIETLSQVSKHAAKAKQSPTYDYEWEWETRKIITGAHQKLLGKEHVSYQLFIPAGRSFFTSIGKAVAAFEQGRILDPLIVRFGRIFTSLRDRPSRFYNRPEKREIALRESLSKILGGKLIKKGDVELVECSDGRQVPFSALSSGQQEILPIVAVLPDFLLRDRRHCIYIEEPEAHLFPSAQSSLVEILANMINQSSNNLDLVITTHSPYVPVKINNLIKAGQLGRSQNEQRKMAVQKILPRSTWLASNSVHAYAIQDGTLVNIVDKDGQINADYLDSVSDQISKEFMQLLSIEVAE